MNAKRCRVLLACAATLTALVVAGCAPVISREVLKEVDQSIRFEELLKNPQAYRGRTVLLGGSIIETQNLPEKTLIVVLQRSLGFRKEPAADGGSKGRFIVSVPGFLDPAIYRPRRRVTVVGSVSGEEVRPLGEIEYTYPIITKRELYIWPSEESSGTQPRVRFGVGIGVGL
jgi:outer membrane lipoprotein